MTLGGHQGKSFRRRLRGKSSEGETQPPQGKETEGIVSTFTPVRSRFRTMVEGVGGGAAAH